MELPSRSLVPEFKCKRQSLNLSFKIINKARVFCGCTSSKYSLNKSQDIYDLVMFRRVLAFLQHTKVLEEGERRENATSTNPK